MARTSDWPSAHIVAGTGRVQSAGGPDRAAPGDTVLIALGELHWDGAAPAHAMVPLALHEMNNNGQEVEWDKQVTDVEYTNLPVVSRRHHGGIASPRSPTLVGSNNREHRAR